MSAFVSGPLCQARYRFVLFIAMTTRFSKLPAEQAPPTWAQRSSQEAFQWLAVEHDITGFAALLEQPIRNLLAQPERLDLLHLQNNLRPAHVPDRTVRLVELEQLGLDLLIFASLVVLHADRRTPGRQRARMILCE